MRPIGFMLRRATLPQGSGGISCTVLLEDDGHSVGSQGPGAILYILEVVLLTQVLHCGVQADGLADLRAVGAKMFVKAESARDRISPPADSQTCPGR